MFPLRLNELKWRGGEPINFMVQCQEAISRDKRNSDGSVTGTPIECDDNEVKLLDPRADS
jgi:hypothetical protein